MKEATIYERKGMLYIYASSKTTVGVLMIDPPVFAIAKDNTNEVGRTIRERLLASREGVPHPKVPTNLFAPVLNLAGVKSVAAFAKLAKCVHASTDDGVEVTLTPTRNGGSREGFVPLPDKAVVALNADEALGTAAVAALAGSE